MSLPDRQLPGLLSLFYDDPANLGDLVSVDSGEVPENYRRLLAHHEHMTVAMEAYHESLVDVDILETCQAEESYARKILLRRQRDKVVVQFGLLRLDLSLLDPAVREEILSGQRPLGRLLVRHNVMRTVRLESLWRVSMAEELKTYFGHPATNTTYGRSATIELDGKKAVEVLEIVAPE